MSELHQFKPPFIVYDNVVEVGDEDGHVCSAENPDIAKAIVVVLNSHADLVSALKVTKTMLADQPIGHAIVDVATMQTLDGVIAAALAKANGGSQS